MDHEFWVLSLSETPTENFAALIYFQKAIKHLVRLGLLDILYSFFFFYSFLILLDLILWK